MNKIKQFLSRFFTPKSSLPVGAGQNHTPGIYKHLYTLIEKGKYSPDFFLKDENFVVIRKEKQSEVNDVKTSVSEALEKNKIMIDENASVKQIYHLIILDESASMGPVRNLIIDMLSSVYDYINKLSNENKNIKSYFSFVSFADKKIKFHEWNKVVKDKLSFNYLYMPAGSTNLLDACCESILKMENELNNTDDYQVLVTIITDGEENSSVHFTFEETRDHITRLKNTGKWYFNYFGAEHDVHKVVKNMNFDNGVKFEKSTKGVSIMRKVVLNSIDKHYNWPNKDKNDFGWNVD